MSKEKAHDLFGHIGQSRDMRTCHTKRSPAFKRGIDRILNDLQPLIVACDKVDGKKQLGDLLKCVKDVLVKNTVDSGCVIGAGEKEMIFTLREKDKLFIPTLEFWISEADRLGLHADKLEDARECYVQAVENLKAKA